MEAGVFEIFGTRYYTHGFGLLLVAPFALWFVASLLRTLYRLLRKKPPAAGWGLYVSGLLTVIAFVVAFWDVYQIGQQATKLCREQGGLHVYKTVEAEGFNGGSSIEYWSKYGFRYIEGESYKGKFRFIMTRGRPTSERINDFISRYKVITEDTNIDKRIGRTKYYVSDMFNNDVLGELIVFGVHAGWADMLFYNLTGFSYSPWSCGRQNGDIYLTFSDVIKGTIKPLRNNIDGGRNEDF